jgi:hypothetical protein
MSQKRFHIVSILVFFGLLFAAGAVTWATLSTGGDRLVASGTLPGANVTITTTAGSADIDLSSATIPRNYKGHRLDIADPYGKHAQGYVYTDGAGTVQNIVTKKGGTTRNWGAIEAGFNATAAGNFPYRIYRDDRVALVAGPTAVTKANTRLDLTSDNAFCWLNGVDLSAYQTGDYYICLYNATGGYAACGYISAVAPAGETLSEEKITGWTNDIRPDLGYETFTPNANAHDIDVGINIINWGIAASNAIVSDSHLAKWVYTRTVHSGSTPGLYLGTSATIAMPTGGYEFIVTDADAATYYTTIISTRYAGWIILPGNPGSNSTSTHTIKFVSDPPSTAVKIVSTHDGATRSWTHKHVSFNPNDAAGVTYKIYYVGD